MSFNIRSVMWMWLSLTVTLNWASGASWFVNPDAAGGNSGRNWTDGWTELSHIDWPKVQPGDTIFLSGGTSNRYYPESLHVEKSGRPDAPIIIRLGQEAPHRGTVSLQGIDLGRHQWITIDGSYRSDFLAPTNVLQVYSITNNIGITCNSTNGTAIYMTSPVGVKLHWIGVERAERGSAKHAHGIYANMIRRGLTDQNEFKYCWIRNVDDDGIAWIGNDPATHFGHQEVAFSIIEWVGDDGLEANHGFSVHDCLIGPSRFINGHPDGIQSIGSYWKIYNNEFHDFFNSWLRLQAAEKLHHDVLVFNNLFRSGVRGNPKCFLYNTGIEVVQYAAWLGELESMTWSNIVIANNTFFNAPRTVGGAVNWAKRDERTPAAFVHNVFVTNSIVANNVIVNCGQGASAAWQPLRQEVPWGRGVHYATEESLIWDYNTLTGKDAKSASRIGYFGRLHPTGEAMAKNSIWKHNTSTAVVFNNPAQGDFRLASTDNAARGTGTNLSHVFTFDLMNRSRGSNVWDRGAFHFESTR